MEQSQHAYLTCKVLLHSDSATRAQHACWAHGTSCEHVELKKRAWYWRSCMTWLLVFAFSSAVSFIWMLLILIRNSGAWKVSLKAKLSPSATSLPCMT